MAPSSFGVDVCRMYFPYCSTLSICTPLTVRSMPPPGRERPRSTCGRDVVRVRDYDSDAPHTEEGSDCDGDDSDTEESQDALDIPVKHALLTSWSHENMT